MKKFKLLKINLIIPILFYNSRWRDRAVDVVEEKSKLDFQLLENIRDISFTLSADGIVTSVNPAFEKITGLSAKTIIGKPFTTMIHPDNIQSALKTLKSISQGEPLSTSEILLKTEQGAYIVVEGRLIPQFEQGKIIGYLGVARDITQHKQAEEALRESEEMFRLLSEQSFMAICLIQNGKINYVNQAFLKLVEFPLEEVLSWTSKDYIQYIHPEDLEFAQEQGRKKQTGEEDGVVPHYSFRMITPSGETRWVEVYSRTITYKGKPANFITFTDITESKRMEEALRESEERFRLFSEQSLMGICLIQNDTIKYANQAFTEIVECPLEEILTWTNKDYFYLVHPIERQFFRVQGEKIENGEILEISPHQSFRLILKTGKMKWIDVYTKKILYKGNSADFITFVDITERKQIDEALKKSEERFRQIFEEAPIGMALIDLDNHFIKVNNILCEMLGYPKKELTKLSLPAIIHQEHVNKDMKYTRKLKNGEINSYKVETKYVSKRNEILWVYATLSLISEEESADTLYLLMVEDISQRKRMEEEMKRQLIKFNVEDGNIYLAKETSPALSQTVLIDLLKVGYKGIIISRTPESDYKIHMKGEFDFHQLSETNNSNLLNILEEAPRKSVILIDRLEYLFLSKGFENTMQFIYKLSESAYPRALIVILSIDSTTLSSRELSILEKETKQIKSRFLAKVPTEFLEILKFLYQQNNLGINPSYSDTGKELKISRPTVRKRIKELVATGYLIEYKKGNSKALKVSEKGRTLFLT